MKHVYLTAEKIKQAIKERSITRKEAMELERDMKRCAKNNRAAAHRQFAS